MINDTDTVALTLYYLCEFCQQVTIAALDVRSERWVVVIAQVLGHPGCISRLVIHNLIPRLALVLAEFDQFMRLVFTHLLVLFAEVVFYLFFAIRVFAIMDARGQLDFVTQLLATRLVDSRLQYVSTSEVEDALRPDGLYRVAVLRVGDGEVSVESFLATYTGSGVRVCYFCHRCGLPFVEAFGGFGGGLVFEYGAQLFEHGWLVKCVMRGYLLHT